MGTTPVYYHTVMEVRSPGWRNWVRVSGADMRYLGRVLAQSAGSSLKCIPVLGRIWLLVGSHKTVVPVSLLGCVGGNPSQLFQTTHIPLPVTLPSSDQDLHTWSV